MQQFWRDSRLPFVESRRAINSQACYRPHHHPFYSIGAIDAGNSIFNAACGFHQTLQAGDVILIPAHLTHACNPRFSPSWSYQMLHIQTAWLHTSLQSLGQPVPFSSHSVRLYRQAQSYKCFSDCNALLFSTAPVGQKKQALMALLHHLTSAPSSEQILIPATDPQHQQLLTSALRYVDQYGAQKLNLRHWAAAIGLSPFQLIRLFRTCTGLTPQRWLQNHRINTARLALSKKQPISQVAYDLDFADQSHFQRVFKQYTAVTPKQYQA